VAAIRQYGEGLVPWREFPQEFLDPRFFQPDKGLGLKIRQVFAHPFFVSMMDPASPRELMLHGRLDQATPQLVRDQESWQQMLSNYRRVAKDLPQGVIGWVEQAIEANANLLRAQGTHLEATAREREAKLWNWPPNHPMLLLLRGRVADNRAAEATYQLGLCKYEKAARLQARRDLAVKNKVDRPEDAEKELSSAWSDAEGYWKDYTDNYPGRPGFNAARLRRGEAQAMRGDIQEAVRTFQDVSAPMTDLEKLASLLLAKQVAQAAK
jgi:hypothetical protein